MRRGIVIGAAAGAPIKVLVLSQLQATQFSYPEVGTFWSDMTKYAPSAAKSGQALLAWAAVQIIKQVAIGAQAYTSTALLAALQKPASVTVEGLAGLLNLTAPATNPDFARVFARYNYAYKIAGTRFTPMFSGKPQDVSAVLK
jgi:hypothetical protein